MTRRLMLPGNKFRTDGEASCSAPAGVVYEVYLQPGKVVLPGVVKARDSRHLAQRIRQIVCACASDQGSEGPVGARRPPPPSVASHDGPRYARARV